MVEHVWKSASDGFLQYRVTANGDIEWTRPALSGQWVPIQRGIPSGEIGREILRLAKEPARIRQALLAEAKCSCSQYGESLSEGAGEFDRSESRNPDGSDRYVDGERVWPRIVRHHSWCPIALVNRIIPRED